MKTRCYCIACKNHPMHDERKEHLWVTGFYAGRMIFGEGKEQQGVDVDCLEPESDFFLDFDIDPDDYEFPITAYGDGCSETGAWISGNDIGAYCKNEDHED